MRLHASVPVATRQLGYGWLGVYQLVLVLVPTQDIWLFFMLLFML